MTRPPLRGARGGRSRMRRFLGLALIGVALMVPTAFADNPEPPPGLAAALEELFAPELGPIRYFAGLVDLNEDGEPEIVAYVAGPMVCGSGGCNTFVFRTGHRGPELVARISVTRPPIRAADNATWGWRDLVVRVSGGGILPGYDARLRFDGESYPENASVAPAEALAENPAGPVVVPEFESFQEGWPLRDTSD